MRFPGTKRVAVTVTLLGALATASACTDEIIIGDGEPVNPLVATWDATGYTTGGTDQVAAGLSFRLILAANNSYSFVVKSDLDGIICNQGQTACTVTGPFTSTATTITIDAGRIDAFTLNYTIVDATMTWTGTINGATTTVVYTRVP
ncbi:MAG: hypothetical protein CVV20_03175 [Gemmatimonadetes bacterium HGW-Gemmatimonadetes-1]|jgi:hypothetical protein|nr:MAG: hypothetical protein CVV20_03175 [Gemmatimonadetes bacterium HGW-Gemmatimonadetes-1]